MLTDIVFRLFATLQTLSIVSLQLYRPCLLSLCNLPALTLTLWSSHWFFKGNLAHGSVKFARPYPIPIVHNTWTHWLTLLPSICWISFAILLCGQNSITLLPIALPSNFTHLYHHMYNALTSVLTSPVWFCSVWMRLQVFKRPQLFRVNSTLLLNGLFSPTDLRSPFTAPRLLSWYLLRSTTQELIVSISLWLQFCTFKQHSTLDYLHAIEITSCSETVHKWWLVLHYFDTELSTHASARVYVFWIVNALKLQDNAWTSPESFAFVSQFHLLLTQRENFGATSLLEVEILLLRIIGALFHPS